MVLILLFAILTSSSIKINSEKLGTSIIFFATSNFSETKTCIPLQVHLCLPVKTSWWSDQWFRRCAQTGKQTDLQDIVLKITGLCFITLLFLTYLSIRISRSFSRGHFCHVLPRLWNHLSSIHPVLLIGDSLSKGLALACPLSQGQVINRWSTSLSAVVGN